MRTVFAILLTAACWTPALSAAEPAPKAIRLLVPAATLSSQADRELETLVQEYNKAHPSPGARLIRRGDAFSSLRDLMASHLAGDTPEIAAVESAEHRALERARITRPVPASFASATPGLGARAGDHRIPFQYSVPVLVADQEVLFRLRLDGPLPDTWPGLRRLASRLAGGAAGGSAISLPLQGPRGLWLFEALAGKPLWRREAGGLRSNRELAAAIQELQELPATRGEVSWERAIQDFLERKAPLLVTSLDTLPWITQKAGFRWKAALLPAIAPGKRPPLFAGSDLVVTSDDPEIWRLLSFLYAPQNAGRWVSAGGFAPLTPAWAASTAFKKAPDSYRAIAARLPRPHAGRATDADVVRARTEWVSALRFLFGEPSKRLPVETVFTQLDSNLTLK